MIEIHDINKSFGDISAVAGLSFRVNKGEIFGIVGPDGAGKSTLLRMITGILNPDKGRIIVNGKEARNNAYFIKENLAYMPQRFGLYEDLTVEENIYFFGRLFGVSGKDIKERIKRLYQFSRLEPFRKRLAGKLSGGMKQKLGLACSLIHSPELILLDEPTNGVDPVSRREFWKILYDLLSSGVTIVVSTAYLDEAERCTRVAFMYNGSFVKIGRPAEIKADMNDAMLEIVSSNVWTAEMLMRENADYSHVIREGNALRIFTSDPAKAEKSIRHILNARGVGVNSIKKKIPSLENCFMEIISDGDYK